MLQEEKRRFELLREEHAPCALTLKTKEEEVARVAAVVKELEGKLVREIKCRDDKLADLQEQLDALQSRFNLLREEHAPCPSTVAGLREDVARGEQVSAHLRKR